MSFNFDLIADPNATPVTVDEIEVDAEDICLLAEGIFVSDNGDLAVVRGSRAAYQSVIREGTANPGSFPRRLDWGVGLPGMLFKGATVATRDRMVSRARSRLFVNPRIVRVNTVSAMNEDDGVRVSIRADAVTGFIDAEYVVRPPGVR